MRRASLRVRWLLGEIVTFFGQTVGPQILARLSISSSGVATELSTARVTFDDLPARWCTRRASQVSAVVPFEIVEKMQTQVRISYNGIAVRSHHFAGGELGAQNLYDSIPLGADREPFVNSAANPRPEVRWYRSLRTPEGQMSPGWITGSIVKDNLAVPVAPVTVTIGGVAAPPQYAGGAPGLVSGALQVNAMIPPGVSPGNAVPVILTIGSRMK